MPIRYIVQDGDCISSIADRFGFFPGTIWRHPENAGLREVRGNPDVLAPGDVLHVPEVRTKQADCATDLRHRFRRRGVPARLRLRVVVDDEVVADEPYELTIDGGAAVRGRTDADGRIDVPIPPQARAASLTVGEGDDALEFRLRLGHLDPVDSERGLRSRLENCGYPGDLAGALRRFQHDHQLPETGEADPATVQALVTAHGS